MTTMQELLTRMEALEADQAKLEELRADTARRLAAAPKEPEPTTEEQIREHLHGDPLQHRLDAAAIRTMTPAELGRVAGGETIAMILASRTAGPPPRVRNEIEQRFFDVVGCDIEEAL